MVMLEKMDSLVDRVNASPVAIMSASASSESRRLTKDEGQSILRDAIRRQENWGTDYDCNRHTGPAPTLETIVGERIASMGLDADQRARLIEAARHEQQARDGRVRQNRIAALVTAAGRRFADATLKTYRVATPEQAEAIAAFRPFVADIRAHTAAGQGVVLYGGAGGGKTHLAVAGCKVAIAADLSVGWSNGQDLFARFRAAIDGENAERRIVKELLVPDILVIDDLLPPSGMLTEYQASTIYRIVDARYRNFQATWTTINVASGGEAERGAGAQVIDRLRHGALTVFCAWGSYRKGDSK
jgi:DNA replication protein DnaC